MFRKFRWFAFLLALLAVIVVAFQNDRHVEVGVLFFHGQMRLTLLLVGTGLIHFGLGAAVAAWAIRRRARGKAT